MRKWLRDLIVAGAAALVTAIVLLSMTRTSGQVADARTVDGKPNFSGIWS